MLKYELIENTPSCVAYKYYPEGKSEAGMIIVRRDDKEILRMDTASNDEFKWYAMKLYKRIKEWLDCGILEGNGMIAWY